MAKKLSPKTLIAIISAAIAVAALVAIISDGAKDSSTKIRATSAQEIQPVTVVGVDLPRTPDNGDDPGLGLQAPTLKGITAGGMPMTIAPGSDGKPMMLVFLAHWCPHCNREIPVLNEWKAQGLVPDDLTVIGITTGTQEGQPNYPPSQWLVQMNWPWAAMPDSENQDAAKAFGVAGYPTYVVVGADGLVKYRSSGEKSLEEVNNSVRQALSLA